MRGRSWQREASLGNVGAKRHGFHRFFESAKRLGAVGLRAADPVSVVAKHRFANSAQERLS
jgi:hypothetical protein